MRRPAAILFDLDCTLTDRAASLAEFAAMFSGAFDADVSLQALLDADDMGYRPRQAFFRRAREALVCERRPGLDEVAAFWHDVFPACTRPAAGLHGLIGRLQDMGLRLGVVSNGDRSMQRRKLDALGVIDMFGAVVISGEVGTRKPDSRVFRLALERLSIAGADAWFVGDDPTRDVAAARAVGLTTVWRRGAREWPAALRPAEAEIDGLPEILGLLEGT